MFARLAKRPDVRRLRARRAMPVLPIPKDNQVNDRTSASRRRRPALLCRWHIEPASGKPVGSWEVKESEVVPPLEAGPPPLIAAPKPDFRLGAKLVFFGGLTQS
jgi:hypothetical protein